MNLTPILQIAIKKCREDFTRMISDIDFCVSCPCLSECIEQEKQEKREEKK